MNNNDLEQLKNLVISFLDFNDDFWNYIKSRIIYVDSNIKGNELFYNTLMKFDDDNKLIDIKVLIPYIIDLNTALVNVHELKHAYDLYLKLGEFIEDNTTQYEKQAIDKELEFQKKYINIKKGKR